MITSGPGVTERITMGSLASRSPAERRPRQAQSQNPLKNPGNLGRDPEMRCQLQILIPFYPGFSNVPRFFVSSRQRFGAMDIKALGVSQLSGLGQTAL